MMINEKFYSPEHDNEIAQLIAQNITLLPIGVEEITTVEKFNSLVNDFKKNLIIVLFTSPTCPACLQFKPIYERAQKEFGGKGVIFTTVDVSILPEVAQQFGIMGTPTTLFIKNKKVLESKVGFMPPTPFRQLVQRLNSNGNSDVDNLYM